MQSTQQQFEEAQVSALAALRDIVKDNDKNPNPGEADTIATHFQDQINRYRGKVIDELERVLKDEPPATGNGGFSDQDCSNTSCTAADGEDTEMGGT